MSNIKLQNLILLSITPLLAVISLLIAGGHYLDIRHLIMRGFDNKLFAVSTVTASFIDPDVHTSIFEPKEISNSAFDPNRNLIYSITSKGYVYQVNPSTGEATRTAISTASNIGDLTFDSIQNVLYGVRNGEAIAVINPSNGSISDSLPIGRNISGLAFDRNTGLLYGSHESLFIIDLETGETRDVARLGEPMRSLTFHDDVLYGLTEQDNIVSIDTVTGAIAPLPSIRTVTSIAQQPLLSLSADENTLFITGKDQLFQVDLETNSVIAEGFTSGYRNENTPAYQQYIVPMRRIDQRLNLTYVYTQIVSGDSEISYVLDATEGEEHTPIGYVETLSPQKFNEVNYVASTGRVHLSGIQPWEEWGLLKVAYAPILDEHGSVVAMSGADINISIITQKTRVALFRVMSVGIVSLVVGMLASVYIARRMTRPLEELKEAALRIAAGQYGKQIHLSNPKEIAELSKSFNHMSSALQKNLGALESNNETLETIRQQQELIELLGQIRPTSLEHPNLPVIQLYTPEPINDCSGWVSNNDRVLVWLMGRSLEPSNASNELLSQMLLHNQQEALEYNELQRSRLITLRHCKELEIIAARLLERRNNWEGISSTLHCLFPTLVNCFVFYDSETMTIEAIARQSSPFVLITHGQPRKIGNFVETPTLRLEPNQVLVLISTSFLLDQDVSLLEIPELSALLDMLEDVLSQAIDHQTTRKASPIFVAAMTP